MKRTLQLMTLAFGLFVYTNSQAVTICFSDGAGGYYEVTATWTSHKYYVLSGEIFLDIPLTISGYFDLKTNDFYMLWTNPTPDGCTEYVDALEFTATTGSPGYLDWYYSQICDGEIVSGPYYYPVSHTTGHCPVAGLTGSESSIAKVGYIPSGMSTSRLTISDNRTLAEIFMESELTANPMGDGFAFTSSLMEAGDFDISIYNHAGQQVTVLAGNSSTNTVVWDGKTANGENAVSGMYIAVLRNSEETVSVKLIK